MKMLAQEIRNRRVNNHFVDSYPIKYSLIWRKLLGKEWHLVISCSHYFSTLVFRPASITFFLVHSPLFVFFFLFFRFYVSLKFCSTFSLICFSLDCRRVLQYRQLWNTEMNFSRDHPWTVKRCVQKLNFIFFHWYQIISVAFTLLHFKNIAFFWHLLNVLSATHVQYWASFDILTFRKESMKGTKTKLLFLAQHFY